MHKFPLDLSKFKKISSDKNSTTMQHDDGHKLIISHSALDQKKMSALNELPQLEQENKLPETQRFAEGGTSRPSQTPMQQMASNVSHDINNPNEVASNVVSGKVQAPHEQGLARGGPVQKFAEGEGVVPNPQPNQAPPQEADANPLTVEPIPTTPDDASDYASVVAQPLDQDAPATAPPDQAQDQDTPKEKKQAAPAQPPMSPEDAKLQKLVTARDTLNNDNQTLATELASGQIKPHQLNDLFGGKTFLQGLGTFFGLMVGGAGAGLTHTENPVIAAMKNHIANDLEAQKQNIANKQTLLGLNRGRFQDLESQINVTRTQMNRIAAQHIANLANNMSPSDPRKQSAMQNAAMLDQLSGKENFDINTQVAAKQALLSSLGGTGGTDPNYQGNQTFLTMSGNPTYQKMREENDARVIPGIPGQASVPIPPDVRKQIIAMNTLDAKAKDVLDFAQKNQWEKDPIQRQKNAATGSQKAEEMTGFYNASLGDSSLTAGRLKWLDDQINKKPTSVFQEISGNNSKLREIINSNAARRDTLMKSYGFKAGSQDQPQVQMKNGVQYQKVNGGWQKVK